MVSAVDHGERRTGTDVSVVLLAEAETASAAISSAATTQAAALSAAAAIERERVLGRAATEAAVTRSAAARRAHAVEAIAADEAAARMVAARGRSREAVLAAGSEGDRLRARAKQLADRLVEDAERRADELLGSSMGRSADVLAAARHAADELMADVAAVVARRHEDARRSLGDAEGALAVAERDAAAVREAATSRAAQLAGPAAADLELARRLRAVAQRDGGHLVATAMSEAASLLEAAVRSFDAANDLLVAEMKGAEAKVAEPLGVTPIAGGRVEVLPPPARPEPADEAADLPTIPLLVPILGLGRELILRLIVLAGGVSGAWFWLWWLATGHGEWTPGSVTATVVLAWVFCLSTYYFYFICRMTKPNTDVPLPDVRVAMVVTKVPSESWEVLQPTLEAMLTQEYPSSYDVWLADERPSLETLLWCLDHGVKVSTRFAVEDYHQPSWPRRTKSKEGNLAYFYDTVGYERYDVVAQLDADHVPSPQYLREMVRPFADASIGYVAAPSICDANANTSWTVRGRLYAEAGLHGPVQAGSNGGYAPLCIGSHYAVRTAALADVGGLGPELAEDYSTTLWLQSRGWDGVFSIDALAHGDGPATVQEMLVQELQWSRSLCTLLVRWAPGRLRTVSWRARVRMTFALLFYPLNGLMLAAGSVAPVAGSLLRAPWGDTTLAGFYLHLWPNSAVGLATIVLLRRSGLLRPAQAKVWSWEVVVFQLVRWPWVLRGFAEGVYGGFRSKAVAFKVTPKSELGPQPLSVRFMVPTLVLGLVPAWVVVLVGDPGPAAGLLVLAALQAMAYLTSASVVVALHLKSNRRRREATVQSAGDGSLSWWQAGGAAATVTAAAVVPAVVALIWRAWDAGLIA